MRSGAKFWFGGAILSWWPNFVLGVIFMLEKTFWVVGKILCQGKILDGEKLFDEGEIWVGGKILVGAKF